MVEYDFRVIEFQSLFKWFHFLVIHSIDAVVVTMYNTVSALAGRENIRVTEIVRGILSFLITSGGGVSMGIFLGALSSIVTRFTADVRGKLC